MNIDLSADPGIEKSLAQWNEAEKQHIKNHQMKRLLGLSELLSVLRPLRVSVFLSEEGCNPPTASQSWCKQTLTHKHQVLPPPSFPVSSPICQTCTCNPSAFFHSQIPPFDCFSALLSPWLQQQSATEQWFILSFKPKMTYNLLPEKKNAVPSKPERSDMPFLGKCLLTCVHTCFWSTHHQSSIKFTQANHANHQ